MYAAIKAEILAGVYPAGVHLDAKELSARYGNSTTPIRAALYRLAGERLLEIRSNDGFYLPAFSESSLGALYRWTRGLLILAVTAPATDRLTIDPRIAADIAERESADIVEATDRLFLRIGALSGEIELHWALQNAAERLRAIRRLEARYIGDQEAELRALTVGLLRDDRAMLEDALQIYFRRRERVVPNLILLVTHAGEHRLAGETGADEKIS